MQDADPCKSYEKASCYPNTSVGETWPSRTHFHTPHEFPGLVGKRHRTRCSVEGKDSFRQIL